jgi:hypothetical protein
VLTRWLTAVALATVLAAPLTAPVTSAGAAGVGCVKKSEFKAAKQGWTPKRVAGTFGTDGKRVTVAEFSEVRRYPKCGGDTWAVVNYERKATGKPLGLTSKYW